MPRLLSALTVAAIVLALPVKADEKPTDAYQKAMRDNAEATREMRAAANEIENSGAGAQDYEPFVKATTTMKASFATTLAYWQAKRVDDAVTLARDGAKQVDDLEAAAKDRDYRVVLDSFTALNQTCTACHMAHRTRVAEGVFEIR